MELLDEVNEYNELTGNKYEREYVHENNIYHRHVSAWIMNNDGKILMQKRAYSKKKNPGKWAKTGGHVDATETPEEAIKREVYEEIGLDIPIENINVLDIYKSKSHENSFTYNFLFITDFSEDDFQLQLDEIIEVKYFTIEELEKFYEEKNSDFNFSKWSSEDFYREINLLKDFKMKKLCKK